MKNRDLNADVWAAPGVGMSEEMLQEKQIAQICQAGLLITKRLEGVIRDVFHEADSVNRLFDVAHEADSVRQVERKPDLKANAVVLRRMIARLKLIDELDKLRIDVGLERWLTTTPNYPGTSEGSMESM